MWQSTDKDVYDTVSFYPAVASYSMGCVVVYGLLCVGGTAYRNKNAVETPFLAPPAYVARTENDSPVVYNTKKAIVDMWETYQLIGP